MSIVIDTSVIIPVITNEPHKSKLLKLTDGQELIAPRSVPWEIGNAFSAMLKRGRITLEEALKCLEIYEKIPIRFTEVDLISVLKIADRLNIYAYDAYLIACAHQYKSSLLTLDGGLSYAAKQDKIAVMEVE